MDKQKESPNRLIHEKSPYLLQHAHNPVDWYPWGEEAFQAARQEDKPVFLSIGYSTCHWCHVMAHESFEDTEVAAALRQDFIAVKLDREERPDVDAVYMSFCQAMTGRGGWPLTIVMTPDKKPFFAATYLPKHSRFGMYGLLETLSALAEGWRENRAQLLEASDAAARFLRQQQPDAGAAEPTDALLETAVRQFSAAFDPVWGGFGNAPKFPSPHQLVFLLRYGELTDDEETRRMALHTLDCMYRGGIFDHLGGGFSRYSTDHKWLIPHFEKMLYDNALLAEAYLEAWRQTQNPLYRRIAERTLDYLLRELRDADGGFYCGQDADSEGEEGKFYAFSQAEIYAVLGPEDAPRFCAWFGVSERGNFERKNVLNLLAQEDYARSEEEMAALTRRLYDYRAARFPLHKDDKILAGWNGLAIAALAAAARLLGRADYLQAAQRAAAFIEQNLGRRGGRLFLRWRDNQAAHEAQLDDYAYYAYANLTLYEACFEPRYLLRAQELSQLILTLFPDESGGYYASPADSETLLFRPKESFDGALPSGNSVTGLLFSRLARLDGARFQDAAERQLRFLAASLTEAPISYAFALTAILEALHPAGELTVVSREQEPPAGLLPLLTRYARSGLLVLHKTPLTEAALRAAAPFTADYPLPDTGADYYLCRNRACSAPLHGLDALERYWSAGE